MRLAVVHLFAAVLLVAGVTLGAGCRTVSAQGPVGNEGPKPAGDETNKTGAPAQPGLAAPPDTKKWKFAPFFNRVRKQITEHWHPGEAYKRHAPASAASEGKSRTLLRLQINADGTLADVAVDQPSGFPFLDDEALAAVRQAQPFPEPPRQLLDEANMLTFRLGFMFDASSADKVRYYVPLPKRTDEEEGKPR